MPTFKTSQTAKALKVIGGLNSLARELENEGRHETALTLTQLTGLDLHSLGLLYDLIQNHPTPQSAADELEAA